MNDAHGTEDAMNDAPLFGDGELRFDVVSLDGRLLDSFLLGEVGSWRAAALWGHVAAKTDRDGTGEEA